MDLPHRGTITGMGIPCGITLIVGGGYHGKSTLLNALELGIYDHISGDGREYVIVIFLDAFVDCFQFVLVCLKPGNIF